VSWGRRSRGKRRIYDEGVRESQTTNSNPNPALKALHQVEESLQATTGSVESLKKDLERHVTGDFASLGSKLSSVELNLDSKSQEIEDSISETRRIAAKGIEEACASIRKVQGDLTDALDQGLKDLEASHNADFEAEAEARRESEASLRESIGATETALGALGEKVSSEVSVELSSLREESSKMSQEVSSKLSLLESSITKAESKAAEAAAENKTVIEACQASLRSEAESQANGLLERQEKAGEESRLRLEAMEAALETKAAALEV